MMNHFVENQKLMQRSIVKILSIVYGSGESNFYFCWKTDQLEDLGSLGVMIIGSTIATI